MPAGVVDAARHLLSYNHRRVAKTIRTPEGRTDGVAVAERAAGRRRTGGRARGAGRRPGRAGRRDHRRRGRTPGSTRPTSPCWPGSTRPCCRCRWPAVEAGAAVHHAARRPQVLRRTGIRTAFAYLRIGGDPGRIRREDVTETIRRPSRGIAPMVVDMLTKVGHDVGRRHPPAGRPPVGPRRPEAAGVRRRPRDGGRAACRRSAAAALRAIRTCRSASATPWTSSTGPRREADRSTHADDLVALESVAALHPDAATFEALAPRRARPGRRRPGRPCCCRPCTGSRARSGTTWSSSAPTGGCSPTGWGTTRRGSVGSSTWRSPGPAARWRCWPTPAPRRRSWPSSTAGPRPATGGRRRPTAAEARSEAGIARRRGRRGPGATAGGGRGRGRPAGVAVVGGQARRSARLRRAQRQGAHRHRRPAAPETSPSWPAAGGWGPSASSGGVTRCWPCSRRPRRPTTPGPPRPPAPPRPARRPGDRDGEPPTTRW